MRKIIVLKPTELMKATKYLRKWRGPDGKWRYDYGPQKKTPMFNKKDMEDMSAGQKIKHTTAVLSGVGLPEASYEDVPVPPKINAKDRAGLNSALHSAVPGDYFKDIPMEEINSALKKEGYLLIQEDGTEWDGLLTGSEGEALFRLGKLSEGREVNGKATYKPVPNSGLKMTWHKMPSGKWEVIKYIT
jgi:hypothetical protein